MSMIHYISDPVRPHHKTKIIIHNMSLTHCSNRRPRQLSQDGFGRFVLVLALLLMSGLAFRSVVSHALNASEIVQSGVKGYCLDVHRNSQGSNATVDSWGCNHSSAQTWTLSATSIKHDDDCLAVQADGIAAGNKVSLNNCTDAPGEVWLRDQTGYLNPNSGLCLSLGAQGPGSQLIVADCDSLAQATETWIPAAFSNGQPNNPTAVTSCDSGPEGQRVACNAVKEWTAWQAGSVSHESLLTTYTDGAPYEAWCADFVSYVYKESGHPFSGGETDGWDENLAPNIQYMGFTKHNAAGYTPQPGDIGYFDYPGGHVEIVVSGGPKPTFVYGDSATIDPATGNGDMEANTITQDGANGQVLYYLSPQT